MLFWVAMIVKVSDRVNLESRHQSHVTTRDFREFLSILDISTGVMPCKMDWL